MNTENESTKEIWKPIKNFEGLYEVSNLGRVKSLKRTTRHGYPVVERILKAGTDSRGYKNVTLCKDNKNKTFTMHRLVALTFLPNPEKKRTVNHKNGIKTDNRVLNLEWSTHSENLFHAHRTGLKKQYEGQNHYNSKLTDSDVLAIRANKDGLTQTELAIKFEINQGQVSKIVSRKKWSHI